MRLAGAEPAAEAPRRRHRRHGPDVPEHPPVREHDGAGERHGRSLLPDQCRRRLTSVLRGPKFRREEQATRKRAQELLDFVGLGKSTELLARNMPYGDQRRLEVARALATDPKLILLDEPTAGMNPQETRQASDLIFKIRDNGLAVVVIEHDMRFIFNLCDRVLCLVRGETLVEGTPEQVQSDPRVIEAYIGEPESEEEEAQRGDRDAGGQGPRGLVRQDQGGQEDQLLGRRGRCRHADRHQRCGQDDDPSHDLGTAQAHRR